MGWPSPCVCGARPWPTHMAELPGWGARGSARRGGCALLIARLSVVWFRSLRLSCRCTLGLCLLDSSRHEHVALAVDLSRGRSPCDEGVASCCAWFGYHLGLL